MKESPPPTTTTTTNLTYGINPVFISITAFMDGWADASIFLVFGVYTTMITGNIIGLAISISTADTFQCIFRASIILSYVLGCTLSDFTMFRYPNNRKYSYAIIPLFQIIGIIIIAVVPLTTSWSKFSLLPLIFSFGMENMWTNRIGYTPQMMTGNVQKMTDFLYKIITGIKFSDPKKEKGDAVITFSILISYFAGAIVSATVVNVSPSTGNFANGIRTSMFVLLSLVFFKIIMNNLYSSCSLEIYLGKLGFPSTATLLSSVAVISIIPIQKIPPKDQDLEVEEEVQMSSLVSGDTSVVVKVTSEINT